MLKYRTNKAAEASINLTKSNGALGCKINLGGLRFKESTDHKVGGVKVGSNAIYLNINNVTIGLSGEASLAAAVKAIKGAWKGNLQETLLTIGAEGGPINSESTFDCGVTLNGVSLVGHQVTSDYKTRWEDKDGGVNPKVISIDHTHETTGSVECDTITLDGSIQAVAQGLMELKQTLTEVAMENGETVEKRIDPKWDPAKEVRISR